MNSFRLLTIIIASFFLVTLGMRNAYLSGGTTPKPHPRAVIETAAKETLDVVQQLEVQTSTPLEFFPFSAPAQLITLLTPAPGASFLTQTRSATLAARAPPSPSSLRS